MVMIREIVSSKDEFFKTKLNHNLEELREIVGFKTYNYKIKIF